MRFLLVDRVEACEPNRSIRGWKNAALSEDYFEWHFPERPIVPGMLILEACAQLAGWLEAASSDFEQWFLLDRVLSARYYAFAVPGDRIDLELERLEDDEVQRVADGEVQRAADGEVQRAADGEVQRAADEQAGRRRYRAETRVGEARGAVLEFAGRVVALDTLDARERARRAWAVLRGETT